MNLDKAQTHALNYVLQKGIKAMEDEIAQFEAPDEDEAAVFLSTQQLFAIKIGMHLSNAAELEMEFK